MHKNLLLGQFEFCLKLSECSPSPCLQFFVVCLDVRATAGMYFCSFCLVANLYLLKSCQQSISAVSCRLWTPPGRSTLWRQGFDSPVNRKDNELYCGGYAVRFNFSSFFGVSTCSALEECAPVCLSVCQEKHNKCPRTVIDLHVSQAFFPVNCTRNWWSGFPCCNQNQWQENDGQCGVCGDPAQGPLENEAGTVCLFFHM